MFGVCSLNNLLSVSLETLDAIPILSEPFIWEPSSMSCELRIYDVWVH